MPQSADEDFDTMSIADFLVTGLGTFATAAALANAQGQVRTPGLSLLVNANGVEDIQPIEEKQLTPKWKTYKCMH